MSLIWPPAEDDVVRDEPRLHALVIAVGDYPHLNGGSGPLAADPLGLNQITTPRFSGPAISSWLLTQYANPDCRLGSVEVLVSPGALVPTPKGPARAEPATMVNVDAAVRAWKNRCDGQRDNIAFMYFCGHGLSKNGQFLLPEDFADPSKGSPWKNCVAFDELRVQMRTCKAQTQLFFVDACRETPFGTLTQITVSGDPIIGGATFSDTVDCSAAYYATTETRQAYGPDDDVTYFCQALLWCFDGVGAIKHGANWFVDTYSLANGLGQAMAQLARRYRLALTCNPNPSGMKAFHQPIGPRVVAAIGCTSESADTVADITLTKDAAVLRSPPGHPKPLVVSVEAGEWQILVTFPAGGYASVGPETYTLMPPLFEGVDVP